MKIVLNEEFGIIRGLADNWNLVGKSGVALFK